MEILDNLREAAKRRARIRRAASGNVPAGKRPIRATAPRPAGIPRRATKPDVFIPGGEFEGAVHLPAGPGRLPARTAPLEEKKLSIHRELLGIGREAILSRARAIAAPRTVPTPGVSQAGMLALPGPVISAGRKFIPGAARAVGQFLTGVAVGGFFARNADGSCPVGTHPIKQDGVKGPAGSYCVRNRRMNIGNARAARRAVRRLKGARKLLRDIEKMMPSKTRARRPTHAVPSKIIHTG